MDLGAYCCYSIVLADGVRTLLTTRVSTLLRWCLGVSVRWKMISPYLETFHIRLFLISEIRKYSSLALLLHSENFKRGWHGWFYPLMPSSIYINLILGHVHSPTSANRIVVRWYYLMHNCDTVFEQLNSLEMITKPVSVEWKPSMSHSCTRERCRLNAHIRLFILSSMYWPCYVILLACFI